MPTQNKAHQTGIIASLTRSGLDAAGLIVFFAAAWHLTDIAGALLA